MSLTVETALKSLAFSESLPDPVVAQLMALAVMEQARAGTVLFREGAVHDRFSIVVDGHVGLEMTVPARGVTRILSLGPGDILAWSALLAHGRMSASAVAMSDVQLLSFPGSELRRLCETNHEVGFHVMERVSAAVSRRLLATRLQLLDLFSSNSPPIDPQPRV